MSQELTETRSGIDAGFKSWFPVITLITVTLFIFPIVFEKGELYLIPFGLITGMIFLFFRKFLFAFLCFTLPYSHETRFSTINFNISFPGETLIGLLAIWGTYCIVFKGKEERKIWSHPITWIILVYWAVSGMTSMTSSMKGVSIKSFVLLTAYLVVFYYLLVRFILRKEIKPLQPYTWYSVLLFFLVIYITYIHSLFGFDKSTAAFVAKPYFSDHTIYGACLAFVMPFTFGLYWHHSRLNVQYANKIFWLVCTLLFAVAVYFSHSRATWMSLFAAAVFYFVLKIRLSFSSFLTIGIIAVIIGTLFIKEISPLLFQNKHDSKAKNADIEDQVKSVTNMKNDVSNAERVNRWLCAWRMFKDKPLTGYGPGTYQYKYLPFQKSSEMTVISVHSASPNHAQGFGGTAHSEYLLALSELGLAGGLAVFIMIFVVLRTGMNLYYFSSDIETRHTAMIITLCMITYFVHGFFNNFLNTDKSGFLFWSGCAILVALDIKEKNRKSEASLETV